MLSGKSHCDLLYDEQSYGTSSVSSPLVLQTINILLNVISWPQTHVNGPYKAICPAPGCTVLKSTFKGTVACPSIFKSANIREWWTALAEFEV